MINESHSRQLGLKINKLFNTNILIYANNIPLLNSDNSLPFARIITVDERSSLALDQSWEYTSIGYLIFLFSENPPISTENYSVSTDGGKSKRNVNFVRYQLKHGYYELLLKGD